MRITEHRNSINFEGYGHLDLDRVLSYDVIFPWEYNPHKVRPWLIYNEYGPLVLVWAGNEQDALDEAVDSDMLDSLMVDPDDVAKATEEEAEEWARLGNAGEPFDLSNVGMVAINVKWFRTKLLCKFAEARGAGVKTLDKI